MSLMLFYTKQHWITISFLQQTGWWPQTLMHRLLNNKTKTHIANKINHWLVAGVAADAAAEAFSSSSLSSSLDRGTSVSGMVVVWVSGSCSALLFRARIRWCNAAANWPMSLELPWTRRRETTQTPGYQCQPLTHINKILYRSNYAFKNCRKEHWLNNARQINVNNETTTELYIYVWRRIHCYG